MKDDRHNDVSVLVDRIRPARRIEGCSAVLLPFTPAHEIDWGGFSRLLGRTVGAGLTPAVNMDTGFGPQLSPRDRSKVLVFTREALGDTPFIAGAGIFGCDDDPLEAYRASVDEICALGGTPIIFQSDWLSSQRDEALAGAYRAIVGDAPRAIAFELGTMFAPFGRIYALDEFRRLLDIDAFVGAKHSSLDRDLELDRLALRDEHRPDFRIYTGNDLAIDMVIYGSDYLLGLSTFDPEAFAQRDQWWAEADSRFHQLNDALQALGMLAFRDPVPAYKDSAARYLVMCGHLDQATVHPECPRRPDGEEALLRPVAAMIERARTRSLTRSS